MPEENSKSTVAESETALAELDDLVSNGASLNEAFRQTVAMYPSEAALLSDYILSATSVGHPGQEREADAGLVAAVDNIASKTASRLRAESAFPGLLAQGQRVGIDAGTLASKLRLALSVLRKLDQRLIDAATVPAALIETLSRELKVEIAAVKTYLAGSSKLAMGADYKSRKTPRAGTRKQNFIAAIRASASTGEMTAQDRDYWTTISESPKGENT
jgi:hypothetical protein